MAGNETVFGWKTAKTAGNGWKWLEIRLENSQNGWKWLEMKRFSAVFQPLKSHLAGQASSCSAVFGGVACLW